MEPAAIANGIEALCKAEGVQMTSAFAAAIHDVTEGSPSLKESLELLARADREDLEELLGNIIDARIQAEHLARHFSDLIEGLSIIERAIARCVDRA